MAVEPIYGVSLRSSTPMSNPIDWSCAENRLISNMIQKAFICEA